MINWFESKKLAIFFGDVPSVGVRYILPTHTEEEKKSIKKYPFICRKAVTVKLFDKIKHLSYGFTIPKGYCFDGASIPRFFWRVIGSNTDNKFLIAAMVHDILCENHHYVANDRAFSSLVFDSLLQVSDVGKFKRFLMKSSVDLFQRFQGWSE